MITEKSFGKLPTGEEVTLYHIENSKGAYIEVIDFGANWVKTVVPDRDGKMLDVVLGYDTIDGYLVNGCFFGATIGRNGNRIAGGRFEIEGVSYQLAQNENDNNLHSGGKTSYCFMNWQATGKTENSVTFSRVSPDGEQGFPGDLCISVTYGFDEENRVTITYHGVCNKTCVLNLTNHSYFNLAGEGSGTILDHELMIPATCYTPVIDAAAIPTGEFAPVEGTPMDFRTAKVIGKDIDSDFEQIVFGGGFDHNFCPDGYEKGVQRTVAMAYCPESGIAMEVCSDLPAMQFYAGNFIVKENGKNGHIYTKRTGFALETQCEPNAMNTPAFHSPVVPAGESYDTMTSYRFFVKE